MGRDSAAVERERVEEMSRSRRCVSSAPPALDGLRAGLPA
jgi:hypothetical protein